MRRPNIFMALYSAHWFLVRRLLRAGECQDKIKPRIQSKAQSFSLREVAC